MVLGVCVSVCGAIGVGGARGAGWVGVLLELPRLWLIALLVFFHALVDPAALLELFAPFCLISRHISEQRERSVHPAAPGSRLRVWSFTGTHPTVARLDGTESYAEARRCALGW